MFAPIARQLRSVQPGLNDISLLLIRSGFGCMLLIGHGWPKLQSYADLAEVFPDPIGLGSRMSLHAALFAEVVCAALVVFGLATRLAGLVLVFMFAVGAAVVHADDAFFLQQGQAAKEPALLYGIAFLALVILGPGRISFDHLLAGQPLREEKY